MFHEDALPRFHYLVLSSFVGVSHAATILFLLRRRRRSGEAVYALENGYFDHQKIENDLKFALREEMTFYNCWRSSSSQL